MSRIAVIAAAMIVAGAARADPAALPGVWRSTYVYSGQTFSSTIIFQDDRHYQDTLQANDMMTQRSGVYVFDGRLLRLETWDWQPKTVAVYHPLGSTAGYYTHDLNPKPADSTFEVESLTSDQLVVRDITFGPSDFVVTLRRAP